MKDKRPSVREQAAAEVAGFLKPVDQIDPKAKGREYDIPATRDLDASVTRLKEAMLAALPTVKTARSAPDEMRPRHGVFNRLSEEFSGPAWDAFVSEIRATGGNHTAVQVIKSPTGRYEIIDGERRWRACQEVGVHVLFEERKAETPEQKRTLERLFVTANEQRADRSYASKCLLILDISARLGDPSGRQLAEDIGLTYPTVAMRLAHAPLVSIIKDAVADIHTIGRPQIKQLADADATKPGIVAEVIATLGGGRIAFRELLSRVRVPPTPKVTAKYSLVSSKKGTNVSLPPLTEVQQDALRKFLEKLVS